MKKDFPEVQDFCRLIDANLLITNAATQAKFNETKGYFAEQSLRKDVQHILHPGNPATALYWSR